MLILALLCAQVAARSAGIFTAADAHACDFDFTTTKWGCQSNNWNYTTQVTPNIPTRTECKDSDKNRGPKFMWWASPPRPVAPGEFSIRTSDGPPGSDPTSYTPGGIVPIYIRVLKFNGFYRGLLMYAKPAAGNGSKVGNWKVPYEVSPMFGNDKTHQCNQSVMHINAEDKPYVAKFYFLAPPEGTGPIKIRAMLKTGPPNPTDWGGFFQLPDLQLTEGPVQPVSNRWYALPAGQSCSDFCSTNGLAPCDPNALSLNLDGTPALDEAYPCHGALFSDCKPNGNPYADLVNPNGYCYYRGVDCQTGASCSAVGDATKTLFCVCGQYSYNPITGAGPRAVPGFITAILALLTTWSFGRFRLGGLVFLGVALMSISPANAHNWMEGTRGRAAQLGASQFCSPTYPQLNRNEIHMQVAQNQEFVVEWAAAHTDYTYYIAMHDSDADKVSLLTRPFMDSWLNNCTTNNWANDTTGPYTKLHRFRPNFNLNSQEPVSSAGAATYADLFRSTPIYSGSIWNRFADANGDRPSAFWISGGFGAARTQSGTFNDLYILPFNESLYPRSMLAQYEDAYMVNDRICYNSNSPHTWIEGIMRFQHHDAGATFATALFKIPGKKGPGRYQVHYKWSSYCDVMDVDVRSSAGGNVANPYGLRGNASSVTYNLGHHCFIEKPRRVGQCVEVVTDTAQCRRLCTLDTGCEAYQLLPLQLQPDVSGNKWGLFPASSFIPWDVNYSRCNSTQFENKNIPAEGAMVCFTVRDFQDDFNSARPLWSFTEDMDHQGFYGTCYIKARPVTFDYPIQTLPTPTDNKFQFLSKCIPCDNLGQNLSTPRWGPIQSFCADCTANPVPARTITIPPWTFIANGTFRDPAHWLSPGGSPYASADECKLLAARDPKCSKFVMFSQTKYTRIANNNMNNINSSYTFMSNSGGLGYYFTNSSDFAYFRTCACLDADPPTTDDASYMPSLDATQYTMTCGGWLSNNTCSVRGFQVYHLDI